MKTVVAARVAVAVATLVGATRCVSAAFLGRTTHSEKRRFWCSAAGLVALLAFAVPLTPQRAIASHEGTASGLATWVLDAAARDSRPVERPAAREGSAIDALVRAAMEAAALQAEAVAAMTPEAWAAARHGATAVADILDHDAARRGDVRFDLEAMQQVQRGAAAVQVDRSLLWQGAVTIAVAVERVLDAHLAGEPMTSSVTATEYGDVIVDADSAECDSTYDAPAFVIVDLCGDDMYVTPAAGADGLSSVPVSVVVDAVGRDRAIEGWDTASVGAAMNGGLALFIDAAGDDAWGTGAGSQIGGAGHMGGLGVMIDLEGNDSYRAHGFVAPGGKFGAGIFAGAGVLVDAKGSDEYSADTFQQGSGWFGDAFGLLIDIAGDDRYLDISTYSQGSGGVGGVGLLYDHAGDDRYVAYSVFEQGGAACGGIGLLVDFDGNDQYDEPAGFSQGFAASGEVSTGCADETGSGLGDRLLALLPPAARESVPGDVVAATRNLPLGAAAALVDLRGDDVYSGSIYSAGSHVGNAVGLLLDASGADHYQAGECSQASGGGVSRFCNAWTGGGVGVAALVDATGDDTYDLTGSGQGAGYGGSIVVLADGGGSDSYSTGIRDGGGYHVRGEHGAAIDLVGRGGAEPGSPELPNPPSGPGTGSSWQSFCAFWVHGYACAVEVADSDHVSRNAFAWDARTSEFRTASGDHVSVNVDAYALSGAMRVEFMDCVALLVHVSTEDRDVRRGYRSGAGTANGSVCGARAVDASSTVHGANW